MYDFVTHTWNAIKGICPHDCSYCYMKRFPQKPMRLDANELKTDLGTGNFIFVGSSIDMFAEEIPSEWILAVLEHCKKYEGNTYLFQSKNPARFFEFASRGSFPKNTILGTTIETNFKNNFSKAPSPEDRAKSMAGWDVSVRRMVTIEPIMDFYMPDLVELVKMAKPEWVNIGADSKNSNLPEPSKQQVDELIVELEKFTKVRRKTNLARLK